MLSERDKRPLNIVPVVGRAVDWRWGCLGRFYVLPRNGKPVAALDRADDARFDVVEWLRRLIHKDAAAWVLLRVRRRVMICKGEMDGSVFSDATYR